MYSSQAFVSALARRLFAVLPATRSYAMKSRLLRLQGFDVSEGVCCVSSALFRTGALSIGKDSFVGHGVRVFGGEDSRVSIGSRVDIGPHVLVLAGTHEVGPHRRRAGTGVSNDVNIGDGVWIGGGAILIGPCTIGNGSVVAAGAVVKGAVPSDCLYLDLHKEPLALDEE